MHGFGSPQNVTTTHDRIATQRIHRSQQPTRSPKSRGAPQARRRDLPFAAPLHGGYRTVRPFAQRGHGASQVLIHIPFRFPFAARVNFEKRCAAREKRANAFIRVKRR
jgi:hypothetical protein